MRVNCLAQKDNTTAGHQNLISETKLYRTNSKTAANGIITILLIRRDVVCK